MKQSFRLGILPLLLSFFPMPPIFGDDARNFVNAEDRSPGHNKIITQADIPFVITKPGSYRLKESVRFDGPGAAITIQACNVKLHLCTSSILLSDPNATGILVQGVQEFIIVSDGIKNISSLTQTGFGIRVLNSRKGLIKNIFTINHFDGLLIGSSVDIVVQNSQFYKATDAGAFVAASTNIVFDSCVFADCGNGLTFNGPNQDCCVCNSEFPSATFSNLLVQRVNGMHVENYSFSNVDGDPGKANLVQFGDADPFQACNDVIMRNCTIVNRPAHSPVLGNTAPEGLAIFQGSGFLVEDCVIDIDNTGQDPDSDLSGIHISSPDLGAGLVASNVIVRNCVVQGPAINGFYPDVGSSGVVIENCLATGALKDGIFLAGTNTSVVQNNTVVNNGTNGIFLGETCFSNSVNNNVVSVNGFDSIGSSLPPVGNGISIAEDSSANIVQFNQVYDNAVYGIDDEGTGNQIFNNTAYGNVTDNYHAASDVIIKSIPGNFTLTGENINA